MRTTSCLVLVCVVGLALAGPARKLEKKSVSNSLAAKESIAPVEGLAAPADNLGDPIKEAAGANVDRAKKQASTTFCVEIRQNKPTKVDCNDAKPQSEPEPLPTPAPEPVAPQPPAPQPQTPQQPAQDTSPMYYQPQMWEPTYTSYIVQPAGYNPYGGNLLPNTPQFHLAPQQPQIIPMVQPMVQPQQPMVQPQQPMVQPQQPVVQPQQPIVQPQQPIVQPQQPIVQPHQPHYHFVQPAVRPTSYLKPLIKPHVLHLPVHQPNCPVPTGLQCTCSGSSALLPGTLHAKDAEAGANPSNQALALKFIQDLQKNAYPASGAPADSHLAVSGPTAAMVPNPSAAAAAADPSTIDAKPVMMPMSPHGIQLQASTPYSHLAIQAPSGPGLVPRMGNAPSANLFYDGSFAGTNVQHGVRLGREDSNAGAPEVVEKDETLEEAPKPFDVADDSAKNPRVARFLMNENEEASNSVDEA